MKTYLLLLIVACLAYLPAQAQKQKQIYLDLKDTVAVLKELFKIEGMKARYNAADKKTYNCGYWTTDKKIDFNIPPDKDGKYYVRWTNTIPFKTSKGSFRVLCFLTGQHLGQDGFYFDPFQQSVAIVQDMKGKRKQKLVKFKQDFAVIDLFASPLTIRDNGNDYFVIEALDNSTQGGNIIDTTFWYDIDSLDMVFSLDTNYSNLPNEWEENPLHEYKITTEFSIQNGNLTIKATKKGAKGKTNKTFYTETAYYIFDKVQKKFIEQKK